jgi:hypothetical protein
MLLKAPSGFMLEVAPRCLSEARTREEDQGPTSISRQHSRSIEPFPTVLAFVCTFVVICMRVSSSIRCRALCEIAYVI